MEDWITFAGLAFGLALCALMVWLERRPRLSLKPRLFPTTPFMFLGILIFLLAASHAMTLMGVHKAH
jgi:hypothetical protein